MPLTGSRRNESLAGMAPRRQTWRLRVSGSVSLVLHLIIGAILLIGIKQREQVDQLPPPSQVTMLFDTGRKQGPTVPEPSLSPTPPQPSGPPAVAAPEPPAAPPPPPPPAPEPPAPEPPVPEPPVPEPPVPEPPQPAPVVPPIVVPAPEPALPVAPPAAIPSQAPPPEPPPPPPAADATPLPMPPPPVTEAPPPPIPPPSPSKPALPPKPPPPRPRPAQPAKPAAPPKASDFPAPMDFSFGKPQTSAPAARPHARSRAAGSIDMSLGPAAKGELNETPLGDDEDSAAGADWRNELSRWVSEHAYYPEQARQNHDEGEARVHVIADPDGRVKEVELIGKSGSMWLDMALQALFRDATIPPYPPGRRGPIEFNFTMHYILIRPR